MSNDILDRPDTSRRQVHRPVPAAERAARPGSYVDTDGVRRTPDRVGSHTGQSAAVGGYTDRDGVRRAGRTGSCVSAQR